MKSSMANILVLLVLEHLKQQSNIMVNIYFPGLILMFYFRTDITKNTFTNETLYWIKLLLQMKRFMGLNYFYNWNLIIHSP